MKDGAVAVILGACPPAVSNSAQGWSLESTATGYTPLLWPTHASLELGPDQPTN